MPISVVVRTERGDEVAGLRDVQDHLPPSQRTDPDRRQVPFPLVVSGSEDDYPMLASVDPYGDTCFNNSRSRAWWRNSTVCKLPTSPKNSGRSSPASEP